MKSERRKEISFNDTPFSVNETRMLDCQFGQKYYKQKPKQGKKMWLQGTRKMGCMAHIEVKTFTLYTEYAISQEKKQGISKWKMRYMKEEKMRELQRIVHTENPVKTTEVKYFMSFPSNEAHSCRTSHWPRGCPYPKSTSTSGTKNHANDIIRDNRNN